MEAHLVTKRIVDVIVDSELIADLDAHGGDSRVGVRRTANWVYRSGLGKLPFAPSCRRSTKALEVAGRTRETARYTLLCY